MWNAKKDWTAFYPSKTSRSEASIYGVVHDSLVLVSPLRIKCDALVALLRKLKRVLGLGRTQYPSGLEKMYPVELQAYCNRQR